MPYFLLVLAASFIGYKVIPRPPVYQKSAIVITEDKKDYGQNIAAEKVKESDGTNREPPPDKHPATLTEYMEENIKDGADKNFIKETIPPGTKTTAIDLLRAPGEKPPGPRAEDWIDAEIKTLVFTGFDEPSKSITDFFKRREYARLEKLILKDTTVNKMYGHYILGEIKFKNGKYGEAIKHYDMAASSPAEQGLAEFASFRKAESLYNMGKFEQAGEVFSAIPCGSKFLIPETEFSKAQCYLKTGKTKTAAGIMEQLMSKYEGYTASDKANYCTGLILYYQGRGSEAKNFFERAANANFEEQTLSEFYLAKCLEAEGRLLQASALFKKIHDENKKSAVAGDAMFCRGMIFYRMKEYDSAAEIFLNVLRKYPAGAYAPYARFMTGCCRFETGQYRTAIANCEHFMRDSRGREPESRIHHLSARSYAKLGQYKTACEKYRKIIADNPDAACDLALLHYSAGKYDESLHVCRNLLKNKKNLCFDIEKNILFLKAMNHYMKGDAKEAAAQFQGIINSVPDKEVRGKALFMLGMQYMNTGREDLLTTGYLDLADREEIFSNNWRAWAYYLVGNAYYSAGQMESAEKTFEFIIENYPEAPAAKFAESANVACKVAKGDYAAAELKNREFLANFGDDETVRKTSLLAAAGLLFNRENYREAIAACKDFIKNYPRDETVCEALFLEGECLYNLGHFNDACERWKKIIAGNFDSLYILKSYNRLAGTNFGLGKYDTAVFYYRGIRKYFPESDLSTDAQLRIAQSLYNRGKFGAAIDEYKKFLRLYPDDARKKEVLESIRMAYYEKGMKEPGGRGLAEFITLYPGGELSGEAYWQLGIRAFEKKQYRQAAKLFRKIIIEYPQIQSSKLSLYYLAESYYMTGKYEDAVNAFENFIGSFPEDTLRPVSEFHMANALFKMGKIEESQNHYSNLLNSSPENAFAGDAALNKALCFKKLKKWKDAVSEYKLFIRKYPEHRKKEYAMFQVAEINRNSGNYKEAADYYAEIRESGETSESELLYQAAECYRASGDIAKAKQYYVNLSDLKKYEKTFYLPGLVQLAEIFLKEGSGSEAVRVYKKIMANTENEEWLAAAEAKIIEIEEKNKRNEKQP